MATSVQITIIICVTIVLISAINTFGSNKKNKKGGKDNE